MAMPCCRKIWKNFGLNTKNFSSLHYLWFVLKIVQKVSVHLNNPPSVGSCCSWQEHGWEGAEQPQPLPVLRNSRRGLEAWPEAQEAGGMLTTSSVGCGLNSQFGQRKLCLLQQSAQLSSEKVDLSITVPPVRSFIYYELENVRDFLLNWCLSKLN